MTQDRVNLLGLNLQKLETFFTNMGEKRFRATQVLQWLHQFGVDDFEAMTNIGKNLREQLAEQAIIQGPEIVSDHTANDGTRKWALRLAGPRDHASEPLPNTN